jgi:hypothetical protein
MLINEINREKHYPTGKKTEANPCVFAFPIDFFQVICLIREVIVGATGRKDF